MTDWNKVRALIQGRFVKVDDCLLWLGSMSCGYGTVYFEDKNQRVHRLVYQLINGEIPSGCTHVDVLHKCNNKLCCNPLHLYLGTDSANNYDKYRIGLADGRKSLTKEEVNKAKEMHFHGKSLREIGRELKCDHHKVKRALELEIKS